MLTVFTLDQADEWDAVVRSFVEYDVYWLSGYVRAFFLHGDGDSLLLLYEGDGVRGANVVMRRDVADDRRFVQRIPRNLYFDLSSPHGYSGWLIEGDDTAGLFDAYQQWALEASIVSEFVRFHPLIENHRPCEGFYDVVRLGEVVYMALESPDAIWQNLTSKNRNVIRKAMANGVRVHNGSHPSIYRTFRELYEQTMDRDGADEYYYFGDSFYRSLCEDLPHNAWVFWAEKDGTVLAASVILVANGRMSYHLSGRLAGEQGGSLAATSLILYEAALWGCENGCVTFNLGGGVGSTADSLFKFKRAFNKGPLSHFHVGRKVFDQARYDELLGMRGPAKSGFFPAYRA